MARPATRHVILSEAKNLANGRYGTMFGRPCPQILRRSAPQNDTMEGGVRIEDMVVIENGKARVMSRAPKQADEP